MICVSYAATNEVTFNETLHEARIFFSPIYKKHGKELTIIGDWSYDENNAKAMAYTTNHFFIEVYGGALKAKGTNKDSLRAMICHEVGHHIGGAPYVPRYYEDYYLFRGSSEGQADYYAAQRCLKNWFSGENHWRELEKYRFSEKDKKFCTKYEEGQENIGLCLRVITAFKRMLQINIDESVSFQYKARNPNYQYALASSVTHPSKECRLETVYAGVICNAEKKAGCLSFENPIEASRPLCWAGLGFLLKYEYPVIGAKIIDFIIGLNIQHFKKDPYDDDEVFEESHEIIKQYGDIIPALSNYPN